ncbi:glucosaminidase domain-containing protein [Faecalicatena contorta]|uniref:N-acetylglucosaminidase n=1 Tax=Faecalicatena contorta TaxID=39482 RepID=UPI00195F5B4F|nr:glucosaminidase domain-containing protein [Faecalicatena contorta]MBM6684409.1 glucosaminidase domain-containing protein [Faecalicatena contorta]MBM6709279.1 glucosaminidase domain-containing protein [Faecalicatena contorta]
MKKIKLLILLLFMCMVLTGLPAMESKAEEDTQGGETYPELQDENPYRTESVTAMDENGNITEVGDSDGSMTDGDETSSASISTYARSARMAVSSVKVVNFNTKDNAVTEYTEDGTGALGYTNGDYGADAAYLGTSGGKVKFMMSGVIGWVNASEVEVIDLSKAAVVSGYEVENGRLLHGIVYTMATPGYRTKLDNGPAPSYLSAGTKYYSYDGHYFYTDYAVMLSDYQNNTRANSVNPSDPYYNYYQYLPLRSATSYSADTLSAMINSKAGAGSLMANKGSAFIDSQNTYGVNALLMTGVAANESAWGKSSIALSKNNLFGLNAIDSSPGTSANTFASAEACINDFANGWMSRGYLYPKDSRYNGGFLGNKASGINVKYASDPYWGEKAANVAYALDAAQGSQDYGQYTIGVKDTLASSHQTVNVRNASSTSSTVLYTTGQASNYSVLIKDSTPENGFYRIQSDAVLDSGRTSVMSGSGAYSFDAMYAYISSDYVQIVNQGTAVSEPEPEPQPEPEPEPVPATLDSISIAAAPQKTVYTEGETFDPTGMTVQANWSDGSVTDVTGEVSYRTDSLTTDVTAVEISYTSGDVTRTVSQSIQVNAKVTVTGVLINPSEISLYPGDAKIFGVSVQGTGDPSQSVTWSVEGASSSQTVIDENGRLTVGEDETAGQLTVKAQSAADGSQIGQAAVTVVPKESEEPSAPDGAGGSEEYVSADLKDETSGIGVNGEFAENTSLTVTPIGSDSEEYQALVKEAAGKTILGVYELSLDGAVKDGSKIQVTFAVDEQYNGQSILILHYPKADDVTYIERYVATAQDGTVTVEVDSLSPFVIALDEESAGNDASGEQTPEGDEPEVTDEPENSEEPGVTDEPGTTEEPNVTDPAVTGDPDPSDPSATSGGSGTTGDAGSTSGSTGTTLTNTAPAKINDQNGQNSGSASGGANSSQTEAAPRTGDTSAPILWIVLAVAAVAVIVGAVALKKTRK